MSERLHPVVAVLIAYMVMLILVSPAVPTPLSTTPGNYSVRPPETIAPLASVLMIPPIVNLNNHLREIVLARVVFLGIDGSELIDVITARLCGPTDFFPIGLKTFNVGKARGLQPSASPDNDGRRLPGMEFQPADHRPFKGSV